MKRTADIVVVGAGVIGLTTSLRLAQRGLKVLLVERAGSGREASWAGAGMLPPGNLEFATTPEARLRSFSHQLWGDFAAELHETTGIDTGFCRCGSIEFDDPEQPGRLNDLRKQLRAEQIAFEELDEAALRMRSPAVGREFTRAIAVPDFGQVRNPRHLKALEAACRGQGVAFATDEQVALRRNSNGVVFVESAAGEISSGLVCVAAGAWSQSLLAPLGLELPVQPVRGQIVQLRPSQPLFSHVIEIVRRYLVPRRDGLVLVGSTEDHCGFTKQVTSEGVKSLLEFAELVVPELASAEVVRHWAGLRPGSPDELPFMGAVPDCENAFVAAGHFRSGLQMSIGTAELMSQLITGQEPAISVEGLGVDRIRAVSATAR